MTKVNYDAIVVGCGAMGSAASYNLAKRGLKVAAFDRFDLNHTNGSSHGGTRIIRLAYYEDPRYVPLLRRAYKSWRELESKTGRSLLRVTGGLMMGEPEGELVRGVLRSAKEHAILHRVMTPAEVRDEYPAFSLDEGTCAIREEEAGVLSAEEGVRAFVEAAKEEGCEFNFSRMVNGWRGTPEGIEVSTGSGSFTADRVVFCAGPWTSKLVPEVVPTSCERQVPFWFSPGEEKIFGPDSMPVFICEEGGRFFYGIPDMGEGVKIARTHGGEPCDPDAVRREVTDEDATTVLDFVSRRVKKVRVPPIASTTCIYTNTPDLNFAVGNLPDDNRVTVVSACSGHGFKFASVLGEVAADLAIDGKTPYDIGFIGVDRFSGE
ncbi:MAG TPA: N-methyl-L-tryptophan oxidase [Nitrososphaerales archaeon]|nr:N-methyl-L-tryptophan oxidase [Nitrososphaerales archaeon]